MSSYSIKRRINESQNIWPGFVDILATLLIVIIFILMVFTVSQFYLSDAVMGRDKALAELKLQIDGLSKILLTTEEDLKVESKKNIDLLGEIKESEGLLEKRDTAILDLSLRINQLRKELLIVANALEQYEGVTIDEIETGNLGERINKALATRVDQLKNLNFDLSNLNDQLIALNEELDIKDEKLISRLNEIKLKNSELINLNENLIEKDITIFSLREKMIKLNDILSISEKDNIEKESKIMNLKAQVEQSNLQIQEIEIGKKTAMDEMTFLSTELDRINIEIQMLNAALESSERELLAKELKIEVLGDRLNKALTSQVFKLQQYRSEFFGRLKEILGDREDIKVVGDRFIFESELLFESGSASLQEEGKIEIYKIAKTLKIITDKIPSDIGWMVQVEGHTDNVPIKTYLFPSNWELSTARANSVLKLLLDIGFKPNQLSAAGYGEAYPITLGETKEDLRRNRRIELKLTTR